MWVIIVCLELRCSSQPPLNHTVVCFPLPKSMYTGSTCQLIEPQTQKCSKCCLCEGKDKSVPISVLDSNITQWKSLLSRRAFVVIVFTDTSACEKGSLNSVGLWGKSSPLGTVISDLPHSPSQVQWPGRAIWARELEVWFPPRICYEQNLLVEMRKYSVDFPFFSV